VSRLQHWFPWLSFTRQFWKVAVFLTLALLCCVGLAYGIYCINTPRSENNENGSLFLVFSSLVFLATFGWLFLFVKCPRCKSMAAYHVVSRSRYSKWLINLFTMRTCPDCGYADSDSLSNCHRR